MGLTPHSESIPVICSECRWPKGDAIIVEQCLPNGNVGKVEYSWRVTTYVVLQRRIRSRQCRS